MKLYYSPGACSLSPHILAHEAGIQLDIVKVDMGEKKTENGKDFLQINPKGYVPTLELDDGTVITEGVAIDLYLSSLKPEAKLTPQQGSPEFLKFFEQMLFITTELHKGFGGLFAPVADDAKEIMKKKLRTRLAFAAEQLKGKEFLFGDNFTAADAYLFTILNWAPKVKVDLSEWPVFGEYQARIAQRPSVQAAMKMEGLPVAAKKAA
jgi:glutathione S-transferase